MIEALACGTPVIAYDRGSVPEVMDDGVTGFRRTKSRRGSESR
jgi:glycosyltransferase involved in cell wall biosynthesis